MAPGRCRGKRRGRGRCRCCRPADAAEASRRRGETVRLIRACRLTGVIKRDERMQGDKELGMAGLVGSSDVLMNAREVRRPRSQTARSRRVRFDTPCESLPTPACLRRIADHSSPAGHRLPTHLRVCAARAAVVRGCSRLHVMADGSVEVGEQVGGGIPAGHAHTHAHAAARSPSRLRPGDLPSSAGWRGCIRRRTAVCCLGGGGEQQRRRGTTSSLGSSSSSSSCCGRQRRVTAPPLCL